MCLWGGLAGSRPRMLTSREGDFWTAEESLILHGQCLLVDCKAEEPAQLHMFVPLQSPHKMTVRLSGRSRCPCRGSRCC